MKAVLFSLLRKVSFKSVLVLVVLLLANVLFMNKFFGGTSEGLHGVRTARFAGTWYDADATHLGAQLSDFLGRAEKELEVHPLERAFPNNLPVGARILAIVVPHAGYAYSGQTAAFAYEKLKGLPIKRVFLLGPSHYVAFRGCALPHQSSFATPFGPLNVDQTVIKELAHFPYFRQLKEVHENEHSLEMQLPLIKKSLGDVSIIPIAVGVLSDPQEIKLVARALSRYIEKDDLVIVSSDFTHYGPRFDYQPFTSDIAENIKHLDQRAFECLEKSDLDAFLHFHDVTQDTICGFYPCAVLLSMLPEGAHGSLLRYRTSQDVSLDPENNSVSYMAIAFSVDKPEVHWESNHADEDLSCLTEEDGKVLCDVARQSIEHYLDNQPFSAQALLNDEQKAKFSAQRGAFVTLFKLPPPQPKDKKGKVRQIQVKAKPVKTIRDGKELRGCIGYIYPVKSLLESVTENAVSAATKDPRFKPLAKEELKDLEIEITVLTSPKPIDSWKQIKLGEDGVILHKDGQQAVFLPSVATEFGWDLPETLTQLSMKAGCGANGWKEGALFDIFQGKSFEEMHH